jgi:hypothetical protein
MTEEIKPLSKMSYSSASQITGCQRRYYYRKVKGYPQDADAPDDIHFRFGKALHHTLELCQHNPSLHHVEHLNEAIEINQLSKVEFIKIGAMLLSYFNLHTTSKLSCVSCEFTVEDEDVIGHIDAVMVDTNGHWWIVDLKTASSVRYLELNARLHLDLQLNLYASFADDVAKALGLDPKLFEGCRYRTGEKPDFVVKDSDDVGSYHKRAKPLFWDFEVPLVAMNPWAAREYARACHQEAQRVRLLPEHQVIQNFGDCRKYLRNCEYWSRCYGRCASDNKTLIKHFNQGTMVDRTITVDPFAELAEGFDFLS